MIGGLCLWQWNNIQALYAFLTQDSRQIAENLEGQREEHHQAIQDAVGGGLNVRPPSTEQSDAILSGQLTPEEVKEELGITDQLQKTEEPAQEGEPPAYTAQDLVNSCVAELYGCKIDIMAVLAELKRETLAEWNALPAEERTDTKMKEFGLAGLNECYRLEAEVDDQVREILGRYETRLKEIGAKTAILDQLWTYYTEEKAAEKAYYLDKYLK